MQPTPQSPLTSGRPTPDGGGQKNLQLPPLPRSHPRSPELSSRLPVGSPVPAPTGARIPTLTTQIAGRTVRQGAPTLPDFQHRPGPIRPGCPPEPAEPAEPTEPAEPAVPPAPQVQGGAAGSMEASWDPLIVAIAQAMERVIVDARSRGCSLDQLTAEVLQDDCLLDLDSRQWLSQTMIKLWQSGTV